MLYSANIQNCNKQAESVDLLHQGRNIYKSRAAKTVRLSLNNSTGAEQKWIYRPITNSTEVDSNIKHLKHQKEILYQVQQ